MPDEHVLQMVVDIDDEIIAYVDLHPLKHSSGQLSYSIYIYEGEQLFEVCFTPEFSILKQHAEVSVRK